MPVVRSNRTIFAADEAPPPETPNIVSKAMLEALTVEGSRYADPTTRGAEDELLVLLTPLNKEETLLPKVRYPLLGLQALFLIFS